MPRQLRFHVDRLRGTLIHAGGAAIACHHIYAVLTIPSLNCIKATDLRADAAAFALVRAQAGFRAAHEFVLFKHVWLENQFEIGCVYVGVGQYCTQWRRPLANQVCERCCNARLARATFAAQNHQLLHGLTTFGVQSA